MPFSSCFKIPFWFLKFTRPIVNTCEFIESAKSESIQSILDIHQKRKPNSLLVM
ncbi:MAG: hypothetical protein IE881_09290, partial [Epsilonproteobacteria bacterium]|nr:hypothetical protein [Campylobacterota bacterium]